MEYTDDQLYDMSQEELEQAVKEHRQTSEEDITTEEVIEEEINEESNVDSEEQHEEAVEESIEESTAENEQEQEIVEETTPQTYKIKANGKEYDFSVDELIQLAPKAMDYTKKLQQLAPYRKSVSAMQENGITEDDINLLIDIKKGNKEALATIVKSSGVDPLDLETENISYTPNSYGVSQEVYDLQSVISEIQNDNEYVQTQEIVKNFDRASKDMVASDPSHLKNLHIDIKSGAFFEILPYAEKQAVLDNYKKPFLDYYISTAIALSNKGNNQPNGDTNKVSNQTPLQQNQQLKNKVAIPTQGHKKPVKQYKFAEDIDDDDFMKWYKSKV